MLKLEEFNKPIMSSWDFYNIIKKCHMEHNIPIPPTRKLHSISSVLVKYNYVSNDRDYQTHYRITQIPDRNADEIVCLIDRFCHISHLSAMQKWGLTNRQSFELILTRPSDKIVSQLISNLIQTEIEENHWIYRSKYTPFGPFKLGNITHPKYVRRQPVKNRKSKSPRNAIKGRNSSIRVATLGQTFLDMLQQPDLCGGMAHVLEVWEEHAPKYLDQIITQINSANSLAKCRAGYIIEEKIGIQDRRVDTWCESAQRGGSNRLDPRKPYAPFWSDKWKISLNV